MESSDSIERGDLRTLARVSFPLFLFLFCEALTILAERAFLSHLGTEALSSALNGTYLASIFQSSCVAVVSTGLIFVGFYQGRGDLKQIGPCIWQFIWFSLLSSLIMLPLSLWTSLLYFKGTVLEKMGNEYFTLLAWGNFLFPLNTALISFYIGRGKTALVTLLMLGSYALNILLGWVLIFGIEGRTLPLGLIGAPLAKCLSLGIFSLIFFWLFLKKKNREIYGTGSWQFSAVALWSYIRPGIVRAFCHIWWRGSIAFVSYLMIKKGGLYLDIQTAGGTIIAFLLFITTGIYRAVLVIAPNLLGSRNYVEVWRLCWSLVVCIATIGAVLAIPLLIYPETVVFFFGGASKELFEKTFRMINHWVWLYLIAVAVQTAANGLVVAIQDLKVQVYTTLLTIITSILPIYLGLQLWGWDPSRFWLVLTLENGVFAAVFLYRFYQRRWEVIQNRPT